MREPLVLSGPATTLPPRWSRLRVLVIEDHPEGSLGLRRLLRDFGHEVRAAYTGPDGIRLAREWRPDAVLCDIVLPGLDGWAVARELRRDPATAAARLIAVSGYGSEADRRQSREAGFDRHLVKPVDADELLRLLAVTGR